MHANNYCSFVSPQGVTIHAPESGTLIHGTLHAAHLIDTFIEAVKETPEYCEWIQDPNDSVHEALRHLGEDSDDNAPFWFTDEACWLLEDLLDLLDKYAPEGSYFGTTEGDASDFGYWPTSEED